MRRSLIVPTLLLSVALAGCQVHNMDSRLNKAKGDLTGHSATTNERLDSAAKQAVADGNADEALISYEKLYRHDSRDPQTALDYAQVLRKTGNPERAAVVLAPFAKAEDKKKSAISNPALYLEYAAATLEMGKFERAERLLQNLLAEPDAAPLKPQILHLIGVSMDARGMHKVAEQHYREAMDLWQGPPVTVMNNLALNLAHRGYFDEALTLLRQALVMAPDRDIIATNIELVSNLKSTIVQKPTSLE